MNLPAALQFITFNHYATGVDTVPKSRGLIPTVYSTNSSPSPSSSTPCWFPFVKQGDRQPGAGAKGPASCSYWCRASRRSRIGSECTSCCTDSARCFPPLEGMKRREDERNNNIFTLTVTQIQISLIIVLSCWEPGEENINHRVC